MLLHYIIMSKDLITGAEALMRSLEYQGVDTIFGYPGGSIMPVFDALYRELHMQRKFLPAYREK